MSDRYKLTIDEAIGVLPDDERLHTFVSNGMLIGADWPRDEVIKHITDHGGAQLAGGMARHMGHGLCLDPSRRLFVVHDEARVVALEAKIAAEESAS